MGPRTVIVLDTNVISELAKPVPDAAVMGWANSQRRDEMRATAVSEAEMLYGVNLLPDGQVFGQATPFSEATSSKRKPISDSPGSEP